MGDQWEFHVNQNVSIYTVQTYREFSFLFLKRRGRSTVRRHTVNVNMGCDKYTLTLLVPFRSILYLLMFALL